jgi:hypothetical protein
MNKKYIALLLAFIAVSGFASALTAKAVSSATVKLIPSNSQITQSQVGQTLKVNITVENVANLWQWAATASWDPTALNLTGVTEGPLLQQDGESTLLAFAQSETLYNDGVLQDLSCTRMVASGVDGSGTLATLNFKILSFKGTEITLNSTLKQPTIQETPNPSTGPNPNPFHPLIAHTDVGTTITTSQESPSPTASASIQPSSSQPSLSPTTTPNLTTSPGETPSNSQSPSLSPVPSDSTSPTSPTASASASNSPSVSTSNSPQASPGETGNAGLPMDVTLIVVAGAVMAVVIALAVVMLRRKT